MPASEARCFGGRFLLRSINVEQRSASLLFPKPSKPNLNHRLLPPPLLLPIVSKMWSWFFLDFMLHFGSLGDVFAKNECYEPNSDAERNKQIGRDQRAAIRP